MIYPLAQNKSTSNESFWKSSRKFLAANKLLYDKVSSQSTNVGRASIDLTKGGTSEESDSSGSSQLEIATKRPCLSSSLTAKLDEIAQGVSNIQKVLMFMKNMQQTFQCVICKGVVSTLMLWENHGLSGMCHKLASGPCFLPPLRIPNRELDEVLQTLQATMEEQTTAPPAHPAVPSDSDSDFDLPHYYLTHTCCDAQ